MNAKTVKLTTFGSLQVRSRAERVGRNPRTGTEHKINPRHTVVFTPSAQLRDTLNPPAFARYVSAPASADEICHSA